MNLMQYRLFAMLFLHCNTEWSTRVTHALPFVGYDDSFTVSIGIGSVYQLSTPRSNHIMLCWHLGLILQFESTVSAQLGCLLLNAVDCDQYRLRFAIIVRSVSDVRAGRTDCIRNATRSKRRPLASCSISMDVKITGIWMVAELSACWYLQRFPSHSPNWNSYWARELGSEIAHLAWGWPILLVSFLHSTIPPSTACLI